MVRLYAVQAGFSENHFTDKRSYREWVSGLLDEAESLGGLGPDSLVVFPEHIGTFLALMDAGVAENVEEAVKGLLRRYLGRVALYAVYTLHPLRALLRALWSRMWGTYSSVFSAEARRRSAYIVAGSIAEPRGRRVYNVSYIFGPRGGVVGWQAKVHLVDMEEKLGVSPAPARWLRVYETGVGRLGVAVCLDAFKGDVVGRLAEMGAEVLVQPSANPEPWGPRLEEEWRRGAWAAVQRYEGFRVGVNPMAVGSVYGLLFEGVSSIVAPREATRDGTGYLARASSPRGEEVVYAEVNL